MARTAQRLPKFSLEPLIRWLGIDEVIRQIGPERIIAHLGVKRIINLMGVDWLLAGLTPAQRREFKRRLE